MLSGVQPATRRLTRPLLQLRLPLPLSARGDKMQRSLLRQWVRQVAAGVTSWASIATSRFRLSLTLAQDAVHESCIRDRCRSRNVTAVSIKLDLGQAMGSSGAELDNQKPITQHVKLKPCTINLVNAFCLTMNAAAPRHGTRMGTAPFLHASAGGTHLSLDGARLHVAEDPRPTCLAL